jgi:hypothetical protein
MKHLILTLLLLLAINTRSQILIPQDRVSHAITSATHNLQRELFTEPSFMQPVVYIDYCPLFPGILGLTRGIGIGVYMIDLSPICPDSELERVLLHELVHVWQLHTGILISNEDSFTYKSIEYLHKFPYALRPWEIEADKIADRFCK